jgi:carboxymethylenebutenolidase
MGKMIEFPGPGGETIPAYLAISGSGPAPGVCIGQDIFGMSESLTAIADMFAANGFTAMVPDVFFDIEPATDVLPGGAERTSYINTLDTDVCFGYFRSAMDHLRGRSECNGKVATIGFCFGGNLVYLSLARHDADAGASYYGTRLHDYLDEATAIEKPLMLNISEHDHTYSETDRDRILATFDGSEFVTTQIYAERHGFAHHLPANPDDAEAKKIAHSRTFELFAPLKDA